MKKSYAGSITPPINPFPVNISPPVLVIVKYILSIPAEKIAYLVGAANQIRGQPGCLFKRKPVFGGRNTDGSNSPLR